MKTYKDKKGRVLAVKDKKGMVWAVKCGCNRTSVESIIDNDRGIRFVGEFLEADCPRCGYPLWYTTRRAQ